MSQKKRIIKIMGVFFLSYCLIGCNVKKQESNEQSLLGIETSVQTIQKDIKVIEESVENNNDISPKERKEPICFYQKYDFDIPGNISIESIKIAVKENNSIIVFNEDETIVETEALGFSVNRILNQCEPYRENRLKSSSFLIYSGDNIYFGIISLKYGYLKIYKRVSQSELIGWPYYSGFSKYFIIENDWIETESYYDSWSYKTIPAVYDGELLVYDIESDRVIYSIGAKLLHEDVLLSIDKIEYDNDNFRILIGNYYDSDEFVDFKLYTNDDNFNYEILDSFSYGS